MEEHIGYVHVRAIDSIRHKLYVNNGMYYWRDLINKKEVHIALSQNYIENFNKEKYMMTIVLDTLTLSYSLKI